MPFVLRILLAHGLFEHSDPPTPRRAAIRQHIRDSERAHIIGEPELEYMLPNSCEMNGIFCAWDHHARSNLS